MQQTKVLGDFKVFIAAKEILEETIELSLNYDLVVNLKDEYSFNGYDLHWEFQDDDFEYGEEARLVKEFEDCEMYKVYSCTGDTYITVFDKANKIEV